MSPSATEVRIMMMQVRIMRGASSAMIEWSCLRMAFVDLLGDEGTGIGEVARGCYYIGRRALMNSLKKEDYKTLLL